MNTTITTPEQILRVWETAYFKLSPTNRRNFKNHKLTKELCRFSLADIKSAIYVGKKKYLPDILKYISPTKETKRKLSSKEDPALYKGVITYKNRPQGRLRAVVAVNPELWVGNYTSNLEKTSTYNCSVCQSPVIGLKCRCSVAA